MAHQQTIIDSDQRWVINPDSREVAADLDRIELIQGDHNSERITFEIPRFVEGHDMSLSDRVEIHYINIDKKTRAQSKDIYISDDITVENDKATFSWLISGNATKYYGSLNFIILFACFDQENNYVYKWNTEICKKISIGETISNTEAISEEYSDILEKFRAEVLKEAASQAIIEKTLKNMNAENPGATFALYRIGNWEFNRSGFYKFKLEPSSGTIGYIIQIFQKNTLEDGTTPEGFDTKNIVSMEGASGDGQVEAFYAIVDYFDNEKFTTYKMQFINQPNPGKLYINTYDKETNKWSSAISTNVVSAKKVDHPLTINKDGKSDSYNGSSEKSIDIPSKTSELANDSVVSFTESQELTDDQKTQARENIGAISSNDVKSPSLASSFNAGIVKTTNSWGDVLSSENNVYSFKYGYITVDPTGTIYNEPSLIGGGSTVFSIDMLKNVLSFDNYPKSAYFTSFDSKYKGSLYTNYLGSSNFPIKVTVYSSNQYSPPTWKYYLQTNEGSIASFSLKATDTDISNFKWLIRFQPEDITYEQTESPDYVIVNSNDGSLFTRKNINTNSANNVLSTRLLNYNLPSNDYANVYICGSGDDTVNELSLEDSDYPVTVVYLYTDYSGPYTHKYLIKTATGKIGTFSYAISASTPLSSITWTATGSSSETKFAGLPNYEFDDGFAANVIEYNMNQNDQYTPVAYTSFFNPNNKNLAILTQSGLGVDESGYDGSLPNSVRFAGIDNGVYREVTLTMNAVAGEPDVVKNQKEFRLIDEPYYSKDGEIIELGNTYDVWESIASSDPANILVSYKMNGVLYQNVSSKRFDTFYTYNNVSPYDHYLAVNTGSKTVTGPDGADFTFVKINEPILKQIPPKYIPIDGTTITLNEQGQLTLALSNANGVSF